MGALIGRFARAGLGLAACIFFSFFFRLPVAVSAWERPAERLAGVAGAICCIMMAWERKCGSERARVAARGSVRARDHHAIS